MPECIHRSAYVIGSFSNGRIFREFKCRACGAFGVLRFGFTKIAWTRREKRTPPRHGPVTLSDNGAELR